MLFSIYSDILGEAYNKCYLAYQELDSLDCPFEPKDSIAKEINNYTDLIKQELYQIQKKFCAANDNGRDKELLTEIREMFFKLQSNAYDIYSKSSQRMKQIQEIRDRTQASFL